MSPLFFFSLIQVLLKPSSSIHVPCCRAVTILGRTSTVSTSTDDTFHQGRGCMEPPSLMKCVHLESYDSRWGWFRETAGGVRDEWRTRRWRERPWCCGSEILPAAASGSGTRTSTHERMYDSFQLPVAFQGYKQLRQAAGQRQLQLSLSRCPHVWHSRCSKTAGDRPQLGSSMRAAPRT